MKTIKQRILALWLGALPSPVKHLVVGLGAGTVVRLMLVTIDAAGFRWGTSATTQETFTITALFFWLIITMAWEYNQYEHSAIRHKYFKVKWLDTILDLVLGNAGFAAPMLLRNPLLG